MIKLAFEFPVAYAAVFKPLQDYTFALAHLALANPNYRKTMMPIDLLDNGVHENGEPMDLVQLRRTEKLCSPMYITAPDWIHNAYRTVNAFTPAGIQLDADICAVVQAQDVEEAKWVYAYYLQQGAEIIAFPYRADRVTWIRELRLSGLWDKDQWYHMMGLKSVTELKELVDLDIKYCSLDTSKPIKAGAFGISIDEAHGKLDPRMKMTEDQLKCAVDLCGAMREACS